MFQASHHSRALDEKPTQFDKFKEAARKLECDDAEAHFDEHLKKLIKHKRVEKPE